MVTQTWTGTHADPTKYTCKFDVNMAGYVGQDCDIPCVHADPNSDLRLCVCEIGYWGRSCGYECPGGAANPCKGRGVCDPASGQCRCYGNHQGESCSRCAKGFYGPDCLIAIQDSAITSHIITGYISSNSYMKTLDGAFLQFSNGDKPFTVYGDTHIMIEAQKGITETYTSSITAVAFRIGIHILILTPQNGGTFVLNGQQTALRSLELGQYMLVKQSSTQIVVTGPGGFKLEISLSDIGIGLNLKVDQSRCTQAFGVLGKCSTENAGICRKDNIACIIEQIGIAQAVKLHHIGSDLLNQYFKFVSLDFDHTIFAVAGQPAITSGWAVKLENRGYISLPPLDGDMHFYNTIGKSLEIRILIERAVNGTIFSISNGNVSFGVVVVDGKYAIQYFTEIFILNIRVPEGKWTSIGIALNENSGEITFFERQQTGYQMQVVEILSFITRYGSPLSAFTTPVIGKWQSTLTKYLSAGPSGEISLLFIVDRFLIFDKHLSLNEFYTLFEININRKETRRAIYGINFNEGTGMNAVEFMSGRFAVFGISGSYTWVVSNPPVTHQSVAEQKSLGSANVNDTVMAMCSRIKSDLRAICHNMDDMLDFMYLVCLADATATGDADNAIDSAMTAAKECMLQSNLTSSPLNQMCNSFGTRDYPVIGGDNCTQTCVYGSFQDGECVCRSGYFGDSCSKECPGGHSSPCSGHGMCDGNTGVCVCEENWRGDSQCASCSLFFSGPDCDTFNSDPNIGGLITTTEATSSTPSFLSTSKNTLYSTGLTTTVTTSSSSQYPVTKTCRALRNGRFLMFDTKRKTLTKAFDRAVLLEMAGLRILARQLEVRRRDTVTFSINRIFITYENTWVNFEKVRGKTKSGKQRMFTFIGGEKWTRKTRIYNTSNNMVLASQGPRDISLTIDEIGLKMVIHRGVTFLKASMELRSSDWDSLDIKGLCSFVPSSAEDLLTRPYQITGGGTNLTALAGGSATHCSRDVDFSDTDSLDMTNITGKASGLAICCNNAGASVKSLPLFDTTTGEATILFYLKTCAGCDGIILSYTQRRKKSFTLEYDGTLFVTYGRDSKYESDIRLSDNAWYLIALSWELRTRRLVMFAMNSTLAQFHTIRSLPGDNPFVNGGDLSLGKFQISQEDPGMKKTDSFVGCYDSLGFASSALDATTISDLYSVPMSKVKNILAERDITLYYYDFDDDTDSSNGIISIDLSTTQLARTFLGLDMSMKIDNHPLRSCYQRVSDSPQLDSHTAAARRRKRAISDTAGQHPSTQHTAMATETETGYNHTFCTNLFNGSSSALARKCTSPKMVPKLTVALTDCFLANGDLDIITDTITTFADDCQSTLRLSEWPAEQTCQDFVNETNLYPYMNDFCSPACLYGGRSSSTADCVCDAGYWGQDCDKICPGGGVSPCSGHGTCDSATGICKCPPNRQGHDDCSACTPGWYGQDCSITISTQDSDLDKAFTTVGRLGMVYTLDGITYTVHTYGEILLLALGDNVIIQGKFVICYQYYSCLPFIAVRIGDRSAGYATITIQASSRYNSKPNVFVHNASNPLDSPAYFKGFSIHRPNHYGVQFDIESHFSFTVRVDGQYLVLSVQMPENLINKTSGLLSGLGTKASDVHAKIMHFFGSEVPKFNICSSASSNQSELATHSDNILSLQKFAQTWSNASHLDIARFKIDTCDNIFHYPSPVYKFQSQGGYSLKFDGSSISTQLYISTSSTPSVTIELLIKQSVAQSGGLIFAITGHTVFIMISGSTSLELHQYYDNSTDVMVTGLTLEQNEWNKIVWTYSSDTGEATLYVTNKKGAVSRKDTVLSTDIFTSSFVLSIGQWQPPADGRQYTIPEALKGTVDNFMIWNTATEANQVSQLWMMNPAQVSEKLLFSLFFDEGDGSSTGDSVTNLNINLPQYPWKSPEWLPSDLSYSTNFMSDIVFVYFSNNSLQIEAEVLCSTSLLSSDMVTKCPGLSLANQQAFYSNCLAVVAATRLKSAAYNTILEMYSMCEVLGGMPVVEKSFLCSNLSVEERRETTCATSCQHGYLAKTRSCKCFRGYYGDKCEGVCPGGSDKPCSNHGKCLDNGTCSCWWNWNGAADCSMCTSDKTGGLIGPDCFTVTTTSLQQANNSVAAVSSNGFYMTFSGQQISFTGVTGTFNLFSSTLLHFDIQVYQVRCQYGSCVVAISLATNRTSFVITPPVQGHKPGLYRDGHKIYLKDIINVFDTTMTVHQLSLTEILVTVSLRHSLTVSVTIQEEFLQAKVTASKKVCQYATGILGPCSNSNTDYAIMTSEEIIRYVNTNYRLSDSIIHKVLNIPDTGDTAAHFALWFDNTAVSTRPLQYSDGFIPTRTNFSVSMYYKPFSYGGFIVSYGRDITFAVLNTNPVSVYYNGTIINTTAVPELHTWNQIILTFNKMYRHIEVYHFGGKSEITTDILQIDCQGVFESGGILVVGDYAPSKSRYTFGTDVYTGLIAEVSVWKTAIPSYLMYQARKLNLKVSGFAPELSLLYTFTEGVGTIAHEEISGNNMLLPASPWQAPGWVVTDLGLKLTQSTPLQMFRAVNNPKIEILCSDFFDSEIVKSNCANVSYFLRWWYKMLCKISVSSTNNVADTTIVMTNFASLCASNGESTKDLYNLICNLNITHPSWLTEKCSGCNFGYTISNESCLCYYGYYGSHCDSVCPGGAGHPCNGHGVCDVSGDCQCSGHWNGTACDTCSSGWSGTDCTIMVHPHYNSLANTSERILVAQVNLIGQLYTFDRVVFDMPTNGFFRLVFFPTLDISFTGHFSACDTGTSLYICLVGLVFEHEGIGYYVSHEDFSGTSVQLITSNITHMLYGKLHFGALTLFLESQATMTLAITGSALTVKISSISNSLLVTFSIPRTDWNIQDSGTHGLLTACNTPLAIEISNCSMMSVCENNTKEILDSCRLSQTFKALSIYVSNHVYQDTGLINVIEAKFVSPLQSNCLHFTGIGMTVPMIILPQSDFTIELQVKPVATEGTILAYNVGQSYFILENRANGLAVMYSATVSLTYIHLEVKQWNQISLAWRQKAEILEVYVTYKTGSTQVTTVSVPAAVFVSGGSLTVGQSLAGPTVYLGYIDEVRIWSRPHNPSIVRSNFRVKVTVDTSDLFYSWNFNEGIGLIAYERRKRYNMIPVQVLNHPTWAKSDLDLTENSKLDSPHVTHKIALAADVITAARGTCSSLISGFSLSTAGSSIATITSVYETLCIKQVTNTKDTAQAAAVLASIAELYTSLQNTSKNPLNDQCTDLESISKYLGTIGADCKRCVFGDVISGTCVCTSSHSGSACDEVCPIAALGACNTYGGICGPMGAICNCHPHYYGDHHTAESYWLKYTELHELPTKASYACDTCIDHWTGSTCAVALASGKSTQYYVAIVYGSYITALDGRSYTFVVPGVYTYMRTSRLDIQVLFLPCFGTNHCRYMKELAIKTEALTIGIVYKVDMEMQVTVNGIVQLFPITSADADVTVTWTMKQYIRITLGLSSVLVYSSPLGLVTSAKVHVTDAANSSGMVGNAGTWLGDGNCGNDTSLPHEHDNDDMLECFRKHFTPAKAERFINSTYRTESLGSGGYCLALSEQTLVFTGLASVLPRRIEEFTFSYWIRLNSLYPKIKGSHSLVKLTLGTELVELKVRSGQLQVTWGKTYPTSVRVALNLWTFIVFTWSNDGSLMIYCVTETEVQSDTITFTSYDGEVVVDGVTVSASEGLSLEVDCIRAWGKVKMLSEVAADMNNYCGPSPQDPTLLMSVPLDEGRGASVTMTTYSSDDRISIPRGTNTGTIGGPVTNTTWRASSIPVYNVYTPGTLTAQTTQGVSKAYMRAAKDCLALLTTNTSDVNKHCMNMTSSLRDHYLEACIRDYNRAGSDNATKILENSLLFYCQAALEVDECIFSGHMDFCVKIPHKTSFPKWVIFVIAGTVILTLVVIFIVCYCRRKQKRKNAKAKEQGKVFDYEEETSFSWRANAVNNEGSRVTIPRPQIDTEGLDIYRGTVSDGKDLDPDYDLEPDYNLLSVSDPAQRVTAYDNPAYNEEPGASWMQHEIITSHQKSDLTSFKQPTVEAEATWIDKAININVKCPVNGAGATSDDASTVKVYKM